MVSYSNIFRPRLRPCILSNNEYTFSTEKLNIIILKAYTYTGINRRLSLKSHINYNEFNTGGPEINKKNC